MADLATLQAWRTEAEAARHAIALGQGVQEVQRDGRRVIYTRANLADLQQYIRDLDRQISELTGEAPSDPMLRRSAARPMFR